MIWYVIRDEKPLNVHWPRYLSKRHRGDPKGGEMNPKEFRYYEAKDMIIPNIL